MAPTPKTVLRPRRRAIRAATSTIAVRIIPMRQDRFHRAVCAYITDTIILPAITLGLVTTTIVIIIADIVVAAQFFAFEIQGVLL